MKKLLFAVCITLLLLSCGGSSGSGPGTNTEIKKYRITYYDNGSSGGFVHVDNNEYPSGSSVTVLDQNTLYKTDYEFDGWNTKQDSSGTHYNAGDKIEIKNTNILLYAVWKKEE